MLTKIRKLIKNNKGQTTGEYAIILALVVAAAVGMQIWVKRGLQAKQKDAMDFVGSYVTSASGAWGSSLARTNQFEPLSAESSFDITRNVTDTEGLQASGASSLGIDEDTTRTGYQKYIAP